MREIDAFFDDKQTGFLPIEAGTYPAHVVGLTERDVNTKSGKAIVFQLAYKIAEEAKEIEQNVYEMDGWNYTLNSSGNKVPVMNGDGTPKTAKCTHMPEKTFKDKGIFLFPGNANSGRNRRYFELLSVLGVETASITKDGQVLKKLVLLDEDDVVGKPFLVRISQEEFITSETRDLPEPQQVKKKVWKVFDRTPWEDGEVLDPAELSDDVPF
jgi:hypothetical protein|tara:strand:- start:84 stop:719 length:636 start_codon:yes stop_codon:yes gene_type:complete